MKVIFLDFDGVLNGRHDVYAKGFKELPESVYKENVEKRIKLLGEICEENDAKVVIESVYKKLINEETLDSEEEWLQFILDTMKKYCIEVVGITPCLNDIYTPTCKENEILEYLRRHPEVDSFCVIDDDDCKAMGLKSDLDKVRDYLVETIYESEDGNEGLQEYHKEEIKNILQKKRRKI